jgi:hypothetical protein
VPRTLLFLSAAAVGTLLVSTSGAEERLARVRLEWTSAGGCLDAVMVRTQVEEALGRAAFSETDDADLVLVGRAGPTQNGYEAVVTLSRASGDVLGTRTLSSPSPRCDELSLGLPLALALMIDLPLREATVRVSLPVSFPPSKESPPSAARPTAPPEAASPSRLHSALVAGPVLRLGWIPNVAAGARIAAEVGLGPLQVGAEGTWVAPSLVDDGRVSARAWGLSAAIYACPLHAITKRLYGGACAYAEGGGVVADGVRAAPPRSDVAWLLAAGARLRGGVRLSPWTVGLELGGGGFLVRPQLAYDLAPGGSATLVRAWAGTLDILLCAGMSFP